MTFSPVEIIRKKRDGERLPAAAIRQFVDEVSRGVVPDYQAAAMLMAVFFRGLDDEELTAWTDAMLHSGDVLDLSDVPGPKVDKHSTGGVGDMISLALAPLVAACGVVVPMISGRGLGHTGGTLDKLESIPGFSVGLTVEQFRARLHKCGVAMIGQTERLAPADRKLYALRDVTGTVESIPLIASSIMSKKLASGLEGLVLDVKVGSGAFMKTVDDARALARTLVAIGEGAGKRVTAMLTDMDQPLGRWAGNALEVREAVLTLRGDGSPDVRALTLALAVEMLALAGIEPDSAAAQQRLEKAIASGAALHKFGEMVAGQGGDARAVLDEKMPGLDVGPNVKVLAAPSTGYVAAIDAEAIGMAALGLGAGRVRKEDGIDPAVGVELRVKVGDPIGAGDELGRLYFRERGVDEATRRVLGACSIVSDKSQLPSLRPLIHEVVHASAGGQRDRGGAR